MRAQVSLRRTAGSFAALLLFFVASFVPTVAQTSTADYIKKVANGEASAAGVPEKSGKNGWWARSWSQADGRGFYGRPSSASVTENTDSTILIRYTRYTTEYDVEFGSPIWGAYTIGRIAVANESAGERANSNPDFKRPGRFFQEPMVVAQSRKLEAPAISHGTFTSTYDPRFPILKEGAGVSKDEAKKSRADRSIQRGHMVPNNAMKNQGTEEQGQAAQIESFSVANIVPQMAKSNSPTWATLEGACFDWAKELGQVWLIVGPVYNDRLNATYIRKLKGDDETDAPSPDALFYVVLGKRNGVPSAIGFLIPHAPTAIEDFRPFAVSVDEIEKRTGLNFMPDLGEPNKIETDVDKGWLTVQAGVHIEDDDH